MSETDLARASTAARVCSRCNVEKELKMFSLNRAAPDGRKSICKACMKKEYDATPRPKKFRKPKMTGEELVKATKRYKETYHKKHPNKRKDYKLRTTYGITYKEYLQKCEQLDFKCECCSRKVDTMYIDHCHETGVIRGYTCQQCNAGIGLLGDSLEGVLKAMRYLSEQ